MGRQAAFGGVFPVPTVLARMVATSLPQGIEQATDWARWAMLTDEDREERQARLHEAYRRADRKLLRALGPVVRVVCIDGDD